MVPELLSSNLCSLRSNVERCAFYETIILYVIMLCKLFIIYLNIKYALTFTV